jgi:hypothetical protein
MLPNSLEVRPSSSRTHSSITKTTGLLSNPQPAVTTSVKSSKAFTPVPRPAISSSGTKVRTNTPQPRDARVDRENLGDFAEFIRSTGKLPS